MFTQLVNLIGRSLQTKAIAPTKQVSQNPFASQAGNPFVNSYSAGNNPFYGKNKPISGGYFAGYYNGKPNIVGTRLFVEV